MPQSFARAGSATHRWPRRPRWHGAAALGVLTGALLPMSLALAGQDAAAAVPAAPGASRPLAGERPAAATERAASAAPSARFTAAALGDDDHGLTLTRADGRRVAAPRLPEQVGFASPRVSPDGRFVGWLATFDSCCQSYPIPQTLVVLDAAQHLHRFQPSFGAPFAWCFPPGGDRVAYMHTFTHGSNAEFFELLRIADGRPLAHYEYPDEPEAQPRARAQAPAWVRCVPE